MKGILVSYSRLAYLRSAAIEKDITCNESENVYLLAQKGS